MEDSTHRCEWFAHALDKLNLASRNGIDDLREVAVSVQAEMDARTYTLQSLFSYRSRKVVPESRADTMQLRQTGLGKLNGSHAFRSTGDGNCFFNSLSVYFNGTESFSKEYRVRTGLLLALEPHRIAFTPEQQIQESCLLEPSRKYTLIASLAQTCSHQNTVSTIVVDYGTLEELPVRSKKYKDGVAVVPPDEMTLWLENDALNVVKPNQWSCYTCAIAAAAAMQIEILILKPKKDLSVALRPLNPVKGRRVFIFWKTNHFVPLSLDAAGSEYLNRIFSSTIFKTPADFDSAVSVICATCLLYPDRRAFANEGSVPLVELDSEEDNDSCTLTSSHPKRKRLSAPAPQNPSPREPHTNASENQLDTFYFDQNLDECGSSKNGEKQNGELWQTIVEKERARVKAVVNEMFKKDLERFRFSTSGFASDSTVCELKTITITVQANGTLTKDEKSLLRVRARFFYEEGRREKPFRLRMDEENRLLYKTTPTKEKEILLFSDLFDVAWKSHLGPSLTCLPKTAENLARELARKICLCDCNKLMEAIKSICAGCRITAATKRVVPYVPKLIRSTNIMERVQIDLIDMAPDSEKDMRLNFGTYRYVLSMTECFSRYCFLYPLRRKTAPEMHSQLQRFFINEGCPRMLHSDNGKEFINKMVKELLEPPGTAFVHGAPYHPQSQGQVEKLNHKVKRSLAYLMVNLQPLEQAMLWPYFLPSVQHMLNTTVHDSTGFTPFEVFKGYPSTPDGCGLGFDFQPTADSAEHVDMLKVLAPEPDVDDLSLLEMEEQEDELDVKANQHVQLMSGLPEPLRSGALHALEDLYFYRGATRAAVMENVERRLFKNVYRPAIAARQVKIEAGDIFIWRPTHKRRKSAARIKAKVVRIVEQVRTMSQKFKVEYFKNGDRDPPPKTEENQTFFTALIICGRELTLSQKATNNILALSHEPTKKSSSADLDIEKVYGNNDAVVKWIHDFAERLREYFKENRFLSNRLAPSLPTEEDEETYFGLLDDGAAHFIMETALDNAVEGLSSFLEKLHSFREATSFGFWLSALCKWETVSCQSTFKVKNILAQRDLYHKGNCMDCMKVYPECAHKCCCDYFEFLCCKREKMLC